MTGGGVFVFNGDNLIEHSDEPYSSEVDFQQPLERHPEVLAGERISPESPCLWLLIARELGVPDQQAPR